MKGVQFLLLFILIGIEWPFPLFSVAYDGYSAATYISKKAKHTYQIIHAKGIQALLQADQPLTILDARAKKYDDGKRLPGAKLLPHNAKYSEIQRAIPYKNSLVIIYCSNTHCPASRYLAERLEELGYTNIYKYPEGISDWIRRGYSIEKNKS